MSKLLFLDPMPTILYTYSLWYLESHVRKNWMMALLVILYKYQYTQLTMCDQIQNLIRIVMNSLEAQFHQCRRIPATIIVDFPLNRSRDLSQSMTIDQDDKDTPPPSPMCNTEGSSLGASLTMKNRQGSKSPGFRKYQDSVDADETESELVAIPESDLSDSTLQGSFDEVVHFEDICTPFRPDVIRNRIISNITTLGLLDKVHDKENDKKSKRSEESRLSISDNNKWSVQEGVRMMVTSSMLGQPKAQAILNPPANVQKAIVVTQTTGSVFSRAKSKS